ncbi:MAG TPA: hypothetical protein VFE58_16255 [Tepidisphaeraceae bacterium]|jgi:hypothetical protein|nr:hypothetical protein [Tepidisphaeraceae bacterium]
MQSLATTPDNLPSFDAASARRGLLRGVITAIVGTAAVLAGIVFLIGQPDWWRGYIAATVSSLLAAGLSLIPLNIGLNKGFAGLIPAVMAATGVRTLIAVGGCMLAVIAGHYPAVPTFMLMMPYYFALLSIETGFLIKLGKK